MVHEAGHIIMAIVAGFHVREIAIGFGRIVWRKQIGEAELQLKSVPVSGASVLVVPPGKRTCTVPRMTLFLMGGIVASTALAAGLYIGAGGLRSLLGYAACRQSFVGMLFFMTLVSIPINLIPARTWRTLLLYNDGARVIQALVRPNTAASWLLAAPYLKSAADLVLEGNHDAACLILSSGIEALPDSFWLRLVRASLRSPTRSVEEDREELVSVLDSLAENTLQRAYCWNRIACCDVLLNDMSLLPEADEYSRQAVRVASIPSFLGTRGCVLLRKALARNPHPHPTDVDIAPAMGMLRKARRSLGAEKNEKAANAAWLAIAYAHLGDSAEAQRWLRKSRRKAAVPECALAEAEIKRLQGREPIAQA